MALDYLDLPKSFKDLGAAHGTPPGNFVNIIGVVVDLQSPTTTRTMEHMVTYKLLDERLQDSSYGHQGLTVRSFNKDQSLLPSVRGHGDVVLMRNAKTSFFAGQTIILTNWQTRTVVIPAASIPSPTYSIAYMGGDRLKALGPPEEVAKLSVEESAYIINLKAKKQIQDAVSESTTVQLNRKRDFQSVGSNATTDPPEKKFKGSDTFGKKFRLVEEVAHRDYADLCVEVVKKFSTDYSSTELYVTDYTENKAMWYYAPPEEPISLSRDGDAFGHCQQPKKTWPGPYGYLVLKVNVKDPHAQYVNSKLEQGDLVLLRNVKMKIMAEGAKLEGDMWPDHINPEKVQAQKLLSREAPEARRLDERKHEYWTQRAAKVGGKKQQHQPSPKVNKTEKNRKKKERRRAREAAEAAAGAEHHGDGTLNKHVRCSHQEVSVSSIREILDADNIRHTNTAPNGNTYVLPFINARYRARVRVVNFSPKSLEDFAQPALPSNDSDDGYRSPIDDAGYSTPSQKWEWYFSLTLDDASSPQHSTERIEVHVGHEEAQFLLGDMDDPQDLRQSPGLLARLKEKLCILWGNAAEMVEGEELSNLPFECCIAEYGIPMDEGEDEGGHFGYKRLYRMFGTTVL